MNAEEFVILFKKQKDYMLQDYLSSPGTLGNKLIKELNLDTTQLPIMTKLVDVLLTDAFYTILMGLDGGANIGGIQQVYKIYDKKGNLISDCGDIEAALYEVFQEDKH